MSETKIKKVINDLYDTYNNLIEHEKFSIINNSFLSINVNDMIIEALIAILLITYPYKEILPERKAFFDKVKTRLLKTKTKEEVEFILRDL